MPVSRNNKRIKKKSGRIRQGNVPGATRNAKKKRRFRITGLGILQVLFGLLLMLLLVLRTLTAARDADRHFKKVDQRHSGK
ncbi:hypothetical protein [Mucilaginibacter defluvii]|uniref:hypothetical protein n=1 Tax=Mucilaginibacter defluvii TaxID=1196019 RepID=UPI0031EAD6B5